MSFGGKNSDRHLPEENRRADSETGDIYILRSNQFIQFVSKSKNEFHLFIITTSLSFGTLD